MFIFFLSLSKVMLVHYFNSSSLRLSRMAHIFSFVCKSWGDRELNHQLENLIAADVDSQ